jgi:hypothetical protein
VERIEIMDKPKRVVEYDGDLIGEIQRTGTVSIRLYLREKDGHEYLELRKWTDNAGYSGPLRQGITIPPDMLPSLLELLSAAASVLGNTL